MPLSSDPAGAFAIETHGLSKHFGRHTAVDGLTMRVPKGAIAGFIGPNGAGKTTTLRLLLGLVRADAGSATVLGHSLTEFERYLPRVGALVEAPAFYPGLSGRTNLEVLARLGGHPGSRVSELLEVVGLSDRARDRVGTYSLGMKQRLGVAMALLPDPELLILDEPANGLDPLGIIEMREMLRRLAGQGKTILLSSHLLGELEQLTDWLIMLNQGKALFCGPARELFAERVEVVVEAQDAVQLDLVARIAGEAGYAVTREDRVLRIACSAEFAETLNQQAREAGAPDLTIRVREASLEQLFLALLKGDHA
ncbi:bacitracin transport ATP-binding protein BcrA [Arthrobacter sp. Hiyo8]|uniref:ATP-binding cassette domain-containing protein n=1 Tax=Arthrobacter sp. Hiyo1 TaxID=1588020 RepID=UPI0006838DEF|nr:ATP-binding cassette domain-containing protein [Arthrobacter sp. Hiyo1]BAS16313.1 bacitracin transport ATP-binding protein BcrA [Arthrobacter sp. Hiyo8]GAP60571.1 bacitracin transport ATP-binding protein BcrA [Arthrobacter sp. Hiyo1]